MRYSTFLLPAVLLLAAWSSAAATQAAPQSSTPADRAITAPPSPSAPVRPAERNADRAGPGSPAGQQGDGSDVRETEAPALRRERGRQNDGPAGTTVAILIPLSCFAFGAAYLAKQRALAAIQARKETTTKLIDGLLAREDLVSQLDTPAGRRIVDSLTQRPEPAPASRIIRSVQAGIVLTFLGLGFTGLRLLLASDVSSRSGFSVVAVVLTTIGMGLLVSAGVSYLLSKRLGLIQTPDTRD